MSHVCLHNTFPFFITDPMSTLAATATTTAATTAVTTADLATAVTTADLTTAIRNSSRSLDVLFAIG